MKKLLLLMPLFAAFTVSAQVATPSALVTALDSTTQGAVISLSGVNPVSCPEISMAQTWSGGPLIFSDSPESPTTRGMLYKDTNLTATASGVTNRIFVYHCNENTSTSMRFSVLIKNNGSSAGTLTVPQHGMAGPSTDFALVGEEAFYRWLTNAPLTTVSVPAGSTVRLDTNFDTVNVALGDVINGMWDYSFTQPHTIMICALNPSDNPVTVGPTLSVLARDTHERGTFAACNKVYDSATNVVIDTAQGIVQYPIGGNGDTNVTGWDNAVSPPTAETDGGNYGVLYRTHLASSASDGRNFGMLITPRAGSWGGAILTESGVLPGGKFLIPSDEGTFSDESEAAVAGEYSPGAGLTIWLQFMPTAAANFPVRVMAVPY